MTEKYGFVYIWFDRKHKRYYVGSHWGIETDGYICSSDWMKKAYKRRPQDFKRRILSRTNDRTKLLQEEQKWLNLIKPEESKTRYYNLNLKTTGLWHHTPGEKAKTIGEKIGVSNKGKHNGPRTQEVKNKIAATKRANFDKKLAETGSFISDEHRKKLSEAQIGKKQSEKTKMKRSIMVKKQWKDRRINSL